MVPNKNHSEGHLNEIVHQLTTHLERIRDRVAADDQSAAWHELDKTKAYLNRELERGR